MTEEILTTLSAGVEIEFRPDPIGMKIVLRKYENNHRVRSIHKLVSILNTCNVEYVNLTIAGMRHEICHPDRGSRWEEKKRP